MTRKLEDAFREVSKLSEEEQDSFAALVQSALESERKWEASFAKTPDLLARLAAEALDEDARGETLPLGSVGEVQDD